MTKSIMATSALIYANGPLHLGHMLEGIQTDIWVRAQKSLGHHCSHIGGSDAHGTPIMLSAQKKEIAPETMVAHYHQDHLQDLNDYSVHFDQFHSTHSSENESLAQTIFQKMQSNGDVLKKEITQAFDPQENMFLPDRFIKGACPKCKASDQYGDNCEACGATYCSSELINPYSAISGVKPIDKASLHYFFALDHYQSFLNTWLREGHVTEQVANKLQEWIDQGLKPWDISRDAPYFGFLIPGETNKYFYVWLDAPIGYMAALEHNAESSDCTLETVFSPDSQFELHHFIGKDIINFHALVWPAMLKSAGYRQPTAVHAHGFLMIDGQKMSKSRGTFITAKRFARHFKTEQLRYYFASKLGNGLDDIDLNLDDFVKKINSDLVGKVINIASRCAGFITKFHDNTLGATADTPELLEALQAEKTAITTHFSNREYQHAIRKIMLLADKTNAYIDHMKPWQLAKLPEHQAQVQAICTTGLNAFRLIMIYLHPILPNMSEAVQTFLQCAPLTFDQTEQLLLAHTIVPFKPLMQRIDMNQIDALMTDTLD